MRRALSLLFLPLLALAARQDPPAVLADGADTAELEFEVRERGAELVPARLTFLPVDGRASTLFPNTAAAPHELAVRDNVLYSRTGRGRIRMPSGRYTVYASRGLEWSLASRPLELASGARARLAFELVHELDTRGWISGDFHLHTLTYSGHGDANVEERLLACLGEGLELAVATDHDHHTDYRPALGALGLEGALATVTGDEVTTPIGHFNVFPLDPARAPVASDRRDANELFRLLRAETNAFGVVPLIQLNHPRLEGIDCFTRLGLDPVTGTSGDPAYCRDFDAIEVLNDNRSLGYHDPLADQRDTHGHNHSALRDWFHLLDLGERYAALGNSDSHHVKAIVAGYPRNFVRASTDEPAQIEPAEVAASVRAKRVFTTTGPFVELSVAGGEMGSEVRAADGHARMSLRVRAASWVDCDRAKVFVNGELVATVPIPAARTPLRLEQELELCLLGQCARHGHAQTGFPGPLDAWVVVAVEGDDPLTPVLAPEARPLALTNPVWIDGDGDGRWTSPVERIGAELRAQPTPVQARAWFDQLGPEEQALALALVPRGPFAGALLEPGLSSPARAVRLAAARAAERHVLSGSLQGVQRAWKADRDDPFLGALLLRVLVRAEPQQGAASLAGYVQRFGQGALRRYASEILPLFPEGRIAWRLLGPRATSAELLALPAPPGEAVPADWTSPSARALAWKEHASGPEGFVDLAALDGEPTDRTLVYAETFLRASEARTVLCAFGSDDGSRVWLNDALVYEDRAAKGAKPLEALLSLPLRPGWNRLVLEIENQSGAFGFYCRLLDGAVESATRPR